MSDKITINSAAAVGVVCPMCDGYKQVIAEDEEVDCPLCKGKGWVPYQDHITNAINHLITESYQTAKDKGWWGVGYQTNVGEKIALMHSELSEALEDWRAGLGISTIFFTDATESCKSEKKEFELGITKPCGFPVELADLLIRVFDLCGHYNIPLAQALAEKLAYNKTRPYRHGGKLA